MDRTQLELMVKEFKSQYDEVYITGIGDDDYIWRTLTRKEYEFIRTFADSLEDANERICNTAILFPRIDYASHQAKAYVPSSLAPQILEESGFGGFRKENYLLKMYREELTQFDKYIEIIINLAFPYITFEEMENWTKEKLIKYAARAEWQLTNLRGMKDFRLTSANEIQEENRDTEEVQQEGPDIMEIANNLRQRGMDPMFVLRDVYQKQKPAYVERPLIGGLGQSDTLLAGRDAWKKGELSYGRYEIIREQVQKISRR